jgi:hypothetical protein
MVYIVPIGLEIEEKEDQATLENESYFIRKIVQDHSAKFKTLGADAFLFEKMKLVLEQKRSEDVTELSEIIPDTELVQWTLGELRDTLQAYVRPRRSASSRLYKVDSSLLLDNHDGTFHVVAKKKNDAEGLVDWVLSEIGRVGGVTRDFGLSLSSVVAGRDFAVKVVNQIQNFTGMTECKPKNDYEREVAHEVAEMTNAILPNIEISFSKPSEKFEYDVLVPIANGEIVDVEVKDYGKVTEDAHKNSDTLKSKVISSPLDKAKRIGATKTIVVTRGFPQESFSQLKELATSRDVTFVEENNYKMEIERAIVQRVLRRSRPGRYPVAAWHER